MRVLSSPFLPINCMEVGRPSSVNPFNKVIDGCPEKLVGAENLTKGGISSMGDTACGGTAEIGGAGFGMPASMQFIGKKGEENTLIKVSSAYEKMTNWHKMRPLLD